jgi:putative ABC transport system substrate-binding protein
MSWIVGASMPFDQLKRRNFLTLLGGVAAWPLAARAQQPAKVWRIGVLSGGGQDNFTQYDGFVQGMRELGYTEGKDFVTEFRFAEGQNGGCPIWRRSWCG